MLEISTHSPIFPIELLPAKKEACLPSISPKIYIKRDDLLMFGGKTRKIKALLTNLQKSSSKGGSIKGICTYGSAYANHILAMAQLAKILGISIRVFLRKTTPDLLGNYLLTSLLLKKEEIAFVEPKEIERRAKEFAAENQLFFVAEGASDPYAKNDFLNESILENQKEHSLVFDHIFIDSGTGVSALNLLYGSFLPAEIHIVQMAMKFSEFITYSNSWKKLQQIPSSPLPFSQYYPIYGRKFGSTTQENFHYIKTFARRTGVFLDPIYNAKLFQTAERIIKEKNLLGNILIVHSGGMQSLLGFSKQLALFT